MRIIKSMEEKYLLPALDLVEAVFTDHENALLLLTPAAVKTELRGSISPKS